VESTGLRQFRRLADGIIGIGFLQRGQGREVASICWPEGEPKRYDVIDLGGYGIEMVEPEALPPSESEGKLQAEVEAMALEVNRLNASLVESKEATVRVQSELSAAKAEIEALKKSPAPKPEGDEAPSGGSDGAPANEAVDEAAAIEAYLKANGTDVTNKSVIEALKEQGIVVQSAQVTAAKNKLANETVG
jgi:hypothetical protein